VTTFNFSEEQRDAVCKGELCPQCLSPDQIKCVGAVPDGINMNIAYDCLGCGAEWEGY
jgi:hypothetical protein